MACAARAAMRRCCSSSAAGPVRFVVGLILDGSPSCSFLLPRATPCMLLCISISRYVVLAVPQQCVCTQTHSVFLFSARTHSGSEKVIHSREKRESAQVRGCNVACI